MYNVTVGINKAITPLFKKKKKIIVFVELNKC